MPVQPAANIQNWKNKRQKFNNSNKKSGFNNFKKEKKQLKRQHESNEIKSLKNAVQNLDTEKSSKNLFTDFPLSKGLHTALNSCKFKSPTTIQKRTLPYTLKGDNVIAAAKTGSGKTLAFAIPVLESLYREEWSEVLSVGALILAPTRELANQIQIVFKRLIESSPRS